MIFCAAIAVDATVGSVLFVGKTEDVRKLLLGRRDATRIFAENDINYS